MKSVDRVIFFHHSSHKIFNSMSFQGIQGPPGSSGADGQIGPKVSLVLKITFSNYANTLTVSSGDGYMEMVYILFHKVHSYWTDY